VAGGRATAYSLCVQAFGLWPGGSGQWRERIRGC